MSREDRGPRCQRGFNRWNGRCHFGRPDRVHAMKKNTSVMFCAAVLQISLTAGCASTGKDDGLHYMLIAPKEMKHELASCRAVDHRLRQVDSIRWSLREDGAELETDFEQMVQLTLASAAAIAIAVPMISIAYPDPNLILMPYFAAYTDQGDTLTGLRSVRKRVESGEITELEGIEALTGLLDNLCPVSDPNLYRLSDDHSDPETAEDHPR